MEQQEPSAQIQTDDEPACCRFHPIIRIEPDKHAWKLPLDSARQSPARVQLGFDPDRPIVMSGHQPIVFHCGILAKLIALDEIAKQTNAQAVWIVPDQDVVEPGVVRVPVGRGESLHVEMVDLLGARLPDHVPAGSLDAQAISEPAHDSLKPIAQWLDQYASLDSLAQQFGYATIEYACDRLGIDPPRMLFASELFGAEELSSMVETIKADPGRCAKGYNKAVAAHPHAGVRPLSIEPERIELPLWGCRAGELRVAIDSTNIDSFEPSELMPRGLLMSAMARAHLADLFIHGTGGWDYDRISEDWLSAWLGITLTPMAMATATHHLDLGFDPNDLIDPTRAKWEAHHGRHTPAMVGDLAAQGQKDTLVEQIKELSAQGKDPGPLYQQLQTMLRVYRSAHHDELDALDAHAGNAQKMAAQHALAGDRTFSFVFFDDEALEALDRAVRGALR